MFGTAVLNNSLIYKENLARNNITILQFRESFVRYLPLGVFFANLKHGLRQKLTSYLKCNLVDHKLKEMKGYARGVSREYVDRYENLRQQPPRETNPTRVKKIKTSCSDCGNKYTSRLLASCFDRI